MLPLSLHEKAGPVARHGGGHRPANRRPPPFGAVGGIEGQQTPLPVLVGVRSMECLAPHEFPRQSGDPWQRLAANLTVRQCLLELLDAFVRDLSVGEVQQAEVGQSPEVLQPDVGDLGVG